LSQQVKNAGSKACGTGERARPLALVNPAKRRLAEKELASHSRDKYMSIRS